MKLILVLPIMILYANGCPDIYCRECKYIQQQRHCLLCQYSFLNLTKRQCEVPEDKIDNCIVYSETETHFCNFCKDGYVLIGQKCEPCP